LKLYKYRDFAKPMDADFDRLAAILQRATFWCARPEALNDPVECAWTCDYSPTANTIDLVAQLLRRVAARSPTEAREVAERAIDDGRLEALAQPAIDGMIDKCRSEIGLVCFGSSPNNAALWQRYGGAGAGVSVEVDVPDALMDTQFDRVQYSTAKRIHIDQLIRAFLERDRVREVYELALLSKPSVPWSDEAEIRFVSKKQLVSVAIDGSRVARLIVGHALTSTSRQRIEKIASQASVLVEPRGSASIT
jgi:hypothetical protein